MLDIVARYASPFRLGLRSDNICGGGIGISGGASPLMHVGETRAFAVACELTRPTFVLVR